MILKKRQNWTRDISLHQPNKARFRKEIQLKILVLSLGTLYVQQINYLSI
jgi:hypothetical protein